MKLDKYSLMVLISRNGLKRFGNIDRILKCSELDHEIKHYIAYFGDEHHRWGLIKNHNLDYDTIKCLSYWGTMSQRSELKKKYKNWWL